MLSLPLAKDILVHRCRVTHVVHVIHILSTGDGLILQLLHQAVVCAQDLPELSWAVAMRHEHERLLQPFVFLLLDVQLLLKDLPPLAALAAGLRGVLLIADNVQARDQFTGRLVPLSPGMGGGSEEPLVEVHTARW